MFQSSQGQENFNIDFDLTNDNEVAVEMHPVHNSSGWLSFIDTSDEDKHLMENETLPSLLGENPNPYFDKF